MIDLRHGPWQKALADVECDALISDTPYSAQVHDGHDQGVRNSIDSDGEGRRELSYAAWTPEDVYEFYDHWSPRTRGWMAVMSCSNLIPVYKAAALANNRYAFHPIPCVIPGMTVRMAGDGPSSWAIYLNVSRPRTKEFAKWGTLPGDYRVPRGSAKQHIGGKPLRMVSAVVRDYSRPNDLVCDPCMGFATTALACSSLGRRFVGAEVDVETYEKAKERLSGGVQVDMFGGM